MKPLHCSHRIPSVSNHKVLLCCSHKIRSEHQMVRCSDQLSVVVEEFNDATELKLWWRLFRATSGHSDWSRFQKESETLPLSFNSLFSTTFSRIPQKAIHTYRPRKFPNITIYPQTPSLFGQLVRWPKQSPPQARWALNNTEKRDRLTTHTHTHTVKKGKVKPEWHRSGEVVMPGE